MKNYYQLLDIKPTATQEEVKRAFRLQIARYHPDKVQHLGKEFQDMAADRAAELTEAYRILSDETRRAEYDAGLTQGTATAASSPRAAASPPATQSSPSPAADVPLRDEYANHPPQEPEAPTGRGAFTHERATRDEFVRKATIGRFRQALAAIGSEYDESELRGFDFSCVPKQRLFGRGKGPRLLGRFVTRVDSAALVEAWTHAGKAASTNEEICVFLVGSSLAPSRELAVAIAEQRRRTRGRVTVIPVDARDWGAHMPTDAPTVAKSLLERLRSGT